MPSPVVTRRSVKSEVMAILKRHTAETSRVTPESTMRGDLALDSLTVMEIVAEVEDRYDIRIEDDALAELASVGDVLEALEKRLREKGMLV